jgi:hypothetical protein
MIVRVLASMLLFACASVTSSLPASQTTEKSCRAHPQLVGKCFSLHGRLSVYNGAPAIRLWRMGTNRLLGISEQRFALPGYRNLPESLTQQLNQENEIFGDFIVCPFTKTKPHEMQLVCIEAAKNVTVQKRK